MGKLEKVKENDIMFENMDRLEELCKKIGGEDIGDGRCEIHGDFQLNAEVIRGAGMGHAGLIFYDLNKHKRGEYFPPPPQK